MIEGSRTDARARGCFIHGMSEYKFPGLVFGHFLHPRCLGAIQSWILHAIGR